MIEIQTGFVEVHHMNTHAQELLDKTRFVLSVFLILFILAHIFFLDELEEVSEDLRIEVVTPASMGMFNREFRQWQYNKQTSPCRKPCRRC